MWPWVAPMIDELGAAAIGRYFLWRRNGSHPLLRSGGAELPEFRGDLEAFYGLSRHVEEKMHSGPPRHDSPGVQFADGYFASPLTSRYAASDMVHWRRWWGDERGRNVSVIGLGGLVQLGYYWFDRLARSLARVGVEFWMMDEPFNHRRTPAGFRPGELIAGAGPDQLIAAVRQAVIDARLLFRTLRSQGRRVGVVGQSYGGWLSLLIALLEPDLEFVVPLIPMCDLPGWYRAGLPLSRGARRRFPRYDAHELHELLRPVNPCVWKPSIPGGRIDMHAARYDRLVQYVSIERLARSWGSRFTAHREGHYSVFFGNPLCEAVVRFILETVGDAPPPAQSSPQHP